MALTAIPARIIVSGEAFITLIINRMIAVDTIENRNAEMVTMSGLSIVSELITPAFRDIIPKAAPTAPGA